MAELDEDEEDEADVLGTVDDEDATLAEPEGSDLTDATLAERSAEDARLILLASTRAFCARTAATAASRAILLLLITSGEACGGVTAIRAVQRGK